MSKNPKEIYQSGKTPKSKEEKDQSKTGKEDIIICKECEAVYYYKSWHSKLENYDELKKSKDISFTLCPACRMIKGGRYEGEIIVEGVPNKIKKEMKNLIENFGEKAQDRDPLDRVISVEESKIKRPTARQKRRVKNKGKIKGMKELRILTTENQLAQRLGEKIAEVFDGQRYKVSISHSKSGESGHPLTRVRLVLRK